MSECGRHPLNVTYMTQCIKYWIKLTEMSNSRYPKHCYLLLRRLDECGRNTWATKVKHLLFENGFGYVWINNGVGNSSHFLKCFKQRLIDTSV